MLQVEQVLQEHYQLKQKLGQNAGRQTWLAEDLAKQPAEPVIVKLLAFGDLVQWDNLKLFEREASVLKQLNHPQIPKYRDYFSIDDRILWFGLVQDYIPGSSLKELLAQGRRFSKTEVQKIATDILQILVYLHELSPTVLHRDIKPSNLILGQDETIYLVDFSAVQDRAATEGATFTVVGTYGYAPMEQFGGRAVPSSDLYALGATLIHLLTGISPADLPQRNMRIQFNDKVSSAFHFVRWIEALTEPNVEHRFSTARQALKALRHDNIPNSSALTYKPYGSRIQVEKSFNQLEIKIPCCGIQHSDFQLIFVSVLWFSPILLVIWITGMEAFVEALVTVLFFYSPFLLIALLILSYVLIPAYIETYIRFERNYFVIKWKFMKLCFRRRRGKTSTVQSVCTHSQLSIVDGSLQSTVSIETDNQAYRFGAMLPSITQAERHWLIREIRDWLGIKKGTDNDTEFVPSYSWGWW